MKSCLLSQTFLGQTQLETLPSERLAEFDTGIGCHKTMIPKQ